MVVATFQILSDLHLEVLKDYTTFPISPKAPYLALLGDIGCVAKHKDEYLAFLLCRLAQFKVVFLVPGNHEPYFSTWPHVKAVFAEFQESIRVRRQSGERLGEFVLLDQTRFDIDEEAKAGPGTRTEGEKITILGCTLFSHLPTESTDTLSKRINDFQHIEAWTVDQHNSAHESDVQWLNTQVESLQRSGRKIVIFTHYSPTADSRGVDPRHKDGPLAANFATDMRGQPCWESDMVKLWAFGHTHFNCDFKDRLGKQVYANQRGYFGSSQGFDAEQIVEVPTRRTGYIDRLTSILGLQGALGVAGVRH